MTTIFSIHYDRHGACLAVRSSMPHADSLLYVTVREHLTQRHLAIDGVSRHLILYIVMQDFKYLRLNLHVLKAFICRKLITEVINGRGEVPKE